MAIGIQAPFESIFTELRQHSSWNCSDLSEDRTFLLNRDVAASPA